jgi:uncharacterized Zn-finger protein
MIKGINSSVDTSYSIECPHCSEITYSDIHHREWEVLEFGDGYPHGNIDCPSCEKEFHINIE